MPYIEHSCHLRITRWRSRFLKRSNMNSSVAACLCTAPAASVLESFCLDPELSSWWLLSLYNSGCSANWGLFQSVTRNQNDALKQLKTINKVSTTIYNGKCHKMNSLITKSRLTMTQQTSNIHMYSEITESRKCNLF